MDGRRCTAVVESIFIVPELVVYATTNNGQEGLIKFFFIVLQQLKRFGGMKMASIGLNFGAEYLKGLRVLWWN